MESKGLVCSVSPSCSGGIWNNVKMAIKKCLTVKESWTCLLQPWSLLLENTQMFLCNWKIGQYFEFLMYIPKGSSQNIMSFRFTFNLLTHKFLLLVCSNLNHSFDITGTSIRWLHVEPSDWSHWVLVIRNNLGIQSRPDPFFPCEGAGTAWLAACMAS